MTMCVQAALSCTVARVAARRMSGRGTAHDATAPQKARAMFRAVAQAKPRKLAVQPAVERRRRSMRRSEVVVSASSSSSSALAGLEAAVPSSLSETAV